MSKSYQEPSGNTWRTDCPRRRAQRSRQNDYFRPMQGSAADACVWGYPLVLFDAAARRTAQSCDRALEGVRLPNDDLTDRIAWLDLRGGPAALDIDETSRYYSLTLFDAWGRSFASLGTRTTGNQKQGYAIVPPLRDGTAPHGMQTIETPTSRVAVVGQTAKVDGEMAELQFSIVPLGPRDGALAPVGGAYSDDDSSESIATEIARSGGRAFFARLQRLLDDSGRYANAAAWRSVVDGVLNGDSRTLDAAFEAALTRIECGLPLATPIDGWQPQRMFDARGDAYLERAQSSRFQFLAGDEQDVSYRFARLDEAGRSLHGAHGYWLHFDAWNGPPVRAFWSVTACDERLRRFPGGTPASSIRSRDQLVKNSDDSLDILIQSSRPNKQNVNWLAVPEEAFGLILRLYWPRPAALNGVWSPPALRAVTVTA